MAGIAKARMPGMCLDEVSRCVSDEVSDESQANYLACLLFWERRECWDTLVGVRRLLLQICSRISKVVLRELYAMQDPKQYQPGIRDIYCVCVCFCFLICEMGRPYLKGKIK